MRSVLTALATFLLLNLTQGHLTKSHEHHHSTPHSFSSRASALTSQSTAWIPLPPGEKVRGVNLGSWFIIEPWMVPNTWQAMGCRGFKSERECNEHLGLEVLQEKYEKHWGTFYTEKDFNEMRSLGLNTIRLPLPFWSIESILLPSESFASNSLPYITRALRWALNADLQVIISFHALPGRQTPRESFTGDYASTAEFFKEGNYERSFEVLRNWTISSHTKEDWGNVRMIEVVNETEKGCDESLRKVYYRNAQRVIRDTEKSLGITCDGGGKQCLTIQFMDDWWGSGNPTQYIDTNDHVAYDDHLYAQFSVPSSARTREGYLRFLCSTTRPTDSYPVIMGEWSLSTIGGGELDQESEGAQEFFRKFASAQIQSAEKGAGWIFWSWKTELNSETWEYRKAVEAGYIPRDLKELDKNVCEGYSE